MRINKNVMLLYNCVSEIKIYWYQSFDNINQCEYKNKTLQSRKVYMYIHTYFNYT